MKISFQPWKGRFARNFLKFSALTAGIACLAAILALADDADPYLWLEQVAGPRVDAWVQAENKKTISVLESDPHYTALHADALAIAQADDRIPLPRFLAGRVFNFWQDQAHVRGIWRYTNPADYSKESPDWHTALDLDALAAEEKANWVYKGADCEEPAEQHCMVALSDGGEDAVTVREFNLATSKFVDNGFVLPHGKQNSAWQDESTLLVSREWNPGELTTSGYPFIVKRLKRGQALADAVEIFRGSKRDGGYGVSPIAFRDGAGHAALLIERPLSTFEYERYLVTAKAVERLGIPLKSELQGLVSGKLIVSLNEDWTPATGPKVLQGTLVAIDVGEAASDPRRLRPVVIYAPGPRETFESAAVTRDSLIVTILDEVKGRAFLCRLNGKVWSRHQLPLPDNTTIDIADADLHSDNAFLRASGFLQPVTLTLVNAKDATISVVKKLNPKFDASNEAVEQFEAVSTDGVKVPYFVVHPKNIRLDGNNPAILTAYGGFQVSESPRYSGTIGKLWLEKGGVFVLANIRGGGEFGPAWHEAGLKTHRQIIYDDFASVARDLIRRKITSPRRLGIQGGSNGGLLMGVEFTQHPELWNAVDIEVPLLDMVRFESIAAGSSWVGEYGSVSVPAERDFLASISPYNNIHRDKTYPEPFVWTTAKDDRVGPQHARKFAARLKEYGIPYLFYEVTEGGHGAGANLQETAHTTALEMTYFVRKLMN
jgi:prolyl oligopeptidase